MIIVLSFGQISSYEAEKLFFDGKLSIDDQIKLSKYKRDFPDCFSSRPLYIEKKND